MKPVPRSILLLFIYVIYAFALHACNRLPSEPPAYVVPDVQANFTIGALKQMHTVGKEELITADKIIEALIVADDHSGSLYKSIVVQDSTGGILIKMDDVNLFTSYYVGRKIFIKLKGLYVGDYNRTVELGGGIDSSVASNPALAPIAAKLFNQCIIKGKDGFVVQPKIVELNELTTDINDPLQNTLIQLNNFQFTDADTNKTYGDISLLQSALSFSLKNCAGKAITLRNSSYSSFAGFPVAKGNGSITAVYSIYGTAKQLTIRDTNDVHFYNERCAGGSGGKTYYQEDFEKLSYDSILVLSGWKNIAEKGGVFFKGGSTASLSKYAKISAFNAQGNPPEVITWLISSSVNLTTAVHPVLRFKTIDGYDNGATMQLFISTNYTGTNDPHKADWQLVPATFSNGHTNGYGSYLSSGNISLDAFAGQKIHLAFVYTGANPSTGQKKTTTFEIDEIKITGE